jgi:hypothetical protein
MKEIIHESPNQVEESKIEHYVTNNNGSSSLIINRIRAESYKITPRLSLDNKKLKVLIANDEPM